jgi:hypothetical protein
MIKKPGLKFKPGVREFIRLDLFSWYFDLATSAEN